MQKDGADILCLISSLLFFLHYIAIATFFVAFSSIYWSKFPWKPEILYGIHVIEA